MLQDSIMTVQQASVLFNSVVEGGPAFFHSELTPAFEVVDGGGKRGHQGQAHRGSLRTVCDKGAVSHSLLEGTCP